MDVQKDEGKLADVWVNDIKGRERKIANFEDAAALLCPSVELLEKLPMGLLSTIRLAEAVFILLYGVQTLATGHPTGSSFTSTFRYIPHVEPPDTSKKGPYSHVGQMEVKSDLQIFIADAELR
ncbi:hypothetical protein H109_07813 [Trichophyton interdigitale MR816]|uniref:Uncharacterized protein n=1 Tax=Trichophyton interdigitale (strain MR816) TaxID=1215338 RepID=A0A059IYD1_TRIIM|nr:hypothetical protein H101_04958 [Trichophyton interdigitale H6]KDB20227.1 hypothetical protein H109_07813 [Trichophyton interdigitale MR816]